MKHTVTNPCGILLTEEKEVTVIGCPGFLCPCLPENSNDIAINIDAAGGLDITNTVLDAMAINFPAQWGTNYNQVNGRCLAINGQLIIPTNNNSQLSFDEIHMQPGSEILVKTGAELFPSKFNLAGNVIDGCFQMWRGITVENEAVFTSIFTTIRDAQYAVTLGRSTISSAFTFFENNHVGIRTLNNGPLNVVTTGLFPFSGNTFNQAGNLLPYF